ncbi:MAG TPA: radical SAM family heme chaperone HemW [Chryseolinea sp.]|nr:radical SAM family heme chaperone HemW [Chryseolinea sp.]
MAGIYIHIPFCRQACYYCDFHFSTNLGTRDAMVDAISHEFKLRKGYLADDKVETIYLGGGTPSLLTGKELRHIFDAIRQHFVLADLPEITLEANPDDLTDEMLVTLKDVGVNRLSIGIQSFDDDILRSLNRIHNGRAARDSVLRAQAIGFNNISIDLIYAIPDQDLERWSENIAEAIRLNPQHISSYTLTIEEKTILGKWTKQGKFHPVDDDTAADQHDRLVDLLGGADFEHYEVSNFARPGYRSQHNTSYWLGKKYLGIGPGAHSFDGSTRQYNVRDNRKYIGSLAQDEIPATLEVLSEQDKLNEYLLISLRTSWGLDLEKVRRQFGVDLRQARGGYLQNLEKERLATVTGSTLVLTRKGLLLADEIALSLIPQGSQPAG